MPKYTFHSPTARWAKLIVRVNASYTLSLLCALACSAGNDQSLSPITRCVSILFCHFEPLEKLMFGLI